MTVKTSIVGRNIRALLAERGISQVDLAKKAELDPSHLNQIITGKRINIRLATLEKIASALDVGVAALFTTPADQLPRYVAALFRSIAEEGLSAERAQIDRWVKDHWSKVYRFFTSDSIPFRDKQTIVELMDFFKNKAEREREEGL